MPSGDNRDAITGRYLISNLALYDPDNKPPDRPCSLCGCCVAYWSWSQAKKRRARWCTMNRCVGCNNARTTHGFENHIEYTEYLNKGCWICGETADRIDHDHNIHPQDFHSCVDCRRGPICVHHNMMLIRGYTSAEFRQIATALEAYELELAA